MIRTIIITALFFVTISLKAQVVILDSILGTIERNNPELKMYDAQASAFDTYAKGAKSWEAPQLGAGFFMTPYNPSMWRSNNSAGTMDGMEGLKNVNNGMGSFMVQGQQMIPNPIKQNANQKYMQSMSAVERANKSYARNELLSNAKMEYYEWIILKKKLSVLNEQEQLIDYVIKTTEIRYPYQQEKLSSIYKAKATLGEIQNMKVMFQSEINSKRVSLNQFMNRNKEIMFEVDTSFKIKTYETMAIDTSILTTNRSDISAIDKNIIVSKYKQQLERSRLKPDFGIQYAHMFSFGNNSNLFTLMGMVTIPFAPWSSKMYKSAALGLNYEIQSYQRQREAIVNEATGMIESLKLKIKNQKQQIEIYRKSIIPALVKNHKTSLISYEQTTEDLFVVIDALQTLQMAKMELLNRMQDLLILQAEYEKTMEQK